MVISTWRDSLADPSPALVGVTLAGRTLCWMIIVGLLGLGSRLLDRTSPTLAYLAEGSYAVYLLHQTVIVVLAFYAVGLDLPWGAQWSVLLGASVAATFLCYEVVRRVAWLRWLFGMRPDRPERLSPLAERAGSERDTPAAGTVNPVP